MILYINTVSKDEMIIALKEGTKNVAKKIKVNHNQGEKLLPALETFLKAQKVKLSDLKKIVVANRGGSFTSLRIGVITANALAYALKIPVVAEEKTGRKNKKFGHYSIVEPDYDREPNIGAPKSVLF
ncbi:MAG: tRNA (adenosine(37)-N6)-threonylcarbamoyltransferase complex dimerization subunit type 1 TsaB [Candidatus Falkowbacteria bacterium]|nr:tRNA (adenosine(37)-N6)-threonylcarbamoyltransferase complex dimerization subunit type 1 TsaB [Candidatus Falkowbacteria bacterium]